MTSARCGLSVLAVLLIGHTAHGQACGDADAGSCCEANGTPACDDLACCEATCAADAFCCETAWDQICADLALLEPLCLGPDGPCKPGVPDSCCLGSETPESEVCGKDNGTPCSFPPGGELAECGSIFCGTAWADGGVRDTDWYVVELPDPDGDGHEGLRGTLSSFFPGVCFIVDGISSCAPFVVGQIGCSESCANIAPAFACVTAPATYVVFVATGNCDGTGIFDGVPCTDGTPLNDYRLEITCEPCEGSPCDSAEGNCFDPAGNGSPGCDDPACCEAVCAIDPFCCDNTWDGVCAGEAQELCGNDACSPDAGPCGEANGTPGCDDPVCCKKICLVDPFCCSSGWDASCAAAALEKGCATVIAPDNDDCVTRFKVLNGSTEFDTTFATTDGPSPCGLLGNDVWFNYDADFTGDVIIDTCGSSFDTVVAVYASCACKADSNGDGQVNVEDLVNVILDWLCTGVPGTCIGDVNNSGRTDVEDLVEVILAWGPCPPCPGPDDDGDGLPDNLIACNDDCGGDPCDPLQSCLVIATVAGECYKIQVGGFNGAAGPGWLSIEKDNVCHGADGNCALPNGTPGCDDLECCKLICELDPFCCDNQWDQLCADQALASCDLSCPGEGGDCFMDGGNGTPGCDDVECCKKVCLVDPFCCDLAWDGVCANTAQAMCNACNGTDGDCCDPAGNDTPGCDDADCCKLVCEQDPFCCDNQWDGICADQAGNVCRGCDPPIACCDGTGTPEAEACGDDLNGGCNSTPPVFQSVDCGSTICGTAWADRGTRDTDWYLVSVPDPDGNGVEGLRGTLNSAFPGLVFLVDGVAGCTPVVFVLGCSVDCMNVTDAFSCVQAPADYAVFVAAGNCDGTGVFDGFPCGGVANEYRLEITCGPCPPGAAPVPATGGDLSRFSEE